MSKLPVLKPHEVVSRLEALGFVEVRQRGAHKPVSPFGRKGHDRALSQGAGHLARAAAENRARHRDSG
ncbi:MAG: hypothetical protein WED34_00330 [Planctomycetales bacterium]